MKAKSEEREQIEFVAWLKKNYPQDIFLHIPNGKKRNIIDAVRLKAMGVMKGIPDLFFPAQFLWIEMKKSKGGKLSCDQESVIRDLRGCGYEVAVCEGVEAAKSFYEFFKVNSPNAANKLKEGANGGSGS